MRFAFALAVLASTPAAAQPAPHRLSLELEDCLGARAASVRRIVAAEVGDALVGGEAPNEVTDEASTQVRAECGIETVVVAVQHPGTSVRLERRVDLTSVSEGARARLLALSIVELVSSAWAAVDSLPPAPPEPAPVESASTPPVEETPVLPRIVRRDHVEPEVVRERRPFGIRAIGVARVSGSPFHISGGGGLGVEAALPLGLGVGGDIRYEQGSVATQLGDVSLRVAWSTILLLVRPLVGSNALTVGAGAKLGVAWLEGSPRPGVGSSTEAGFVFGPSVASYASFQIAGSGYFHLGLELDWVLRGVTGENGLTGEELARFGGPSLAVTAGFEIQPGR